MSPNVSSCSTSNVASMLLQTGMKRKRTEEDEYSKSISPSPSYEILSLIGLYMDPETLAIASCVSTTWSHCFSSESLWKQVVMAKSSNLYYNSEVAKETMDLFTYKRFVSVVERDAKRRRKNQPEEPKISLSDLMFIFHVSTASSTTKVVCKKGKDLIKTLNDDKFLLEVDVSNYGITSKTKDVRFIWQVVYKDWDKLLTLVDTTKASIGEKYGWFTDELPVKETCSSGGSKLVGDVKTNFKDDALEKIGFKIANSSNDYVSLSTDNILRYLQVFFVV